MRLVPLQNRISARSTALQPFAVDRYQRVLQPSGRKVVGDDLFDALEHLEMMPRIAVGPKRDHGLQRRTAWQSAGNFADENRSVLRQLEARTRPLLHPLEGFQAFGTLAKGAQHIRPLYRLPYG